MMRPEVLQGVFIPFLGTVLGSAGVFFLKGHNDDNPVIPLLEWHL